MCGGGGFFGGITNFVEDIGGGIADLGQSAIDEAQRAGRTIDRTVRNEIPGGWTTAALMAAGAYYAPEIGAWVGSDGATLASAADVAASDIAAQQAAGAAMSGGAGSVGAGGIADLLADDVLAQQAVGNVYTGATPSSLGVPDFGVGMDLGEGIAADYTAPDAGVFGSGVPNDVPNYGVGVDMGEGIAADYAAPDAGIDWTNPDNWDKAGLGAAGMGGAEPSGFAKFLQGAKNFLGKDTGIGGLTTGGALLGAAGLYKLIDMIKEDNKRFGTPGRQDYTGGALSKFKYDPSSFTPTRVDPAAFRPGAGIKTLARDSDDRMPAPAYTPEPRTYEAVPALGGLSGISGLLRENEALRPIDTTQVREPVSPVLQQINNQMLGAGLGGIGRLFGFAGGGKTERPQLTSKAKLAALDPYQRALAELNNAAYNARMPAGMKAPAANVSQMGQFQLASGGISHLGDYSDGGRLLKGPGDGVSDSIPAMIGNKQPARLADGEFVVPARIVSELGNGSTDAGARKLYAMMDRIQKARGNTTGKGKVAKNTRAEKYLPA